MGLIDLILNFAGLLLWLNWSTVRFDPLARAMPKSLAGTLKRAGPSRLQRWRFMTGLGTLLLVRALVYRQIGPALDWTPTLNLAAIVIPFRSGFSGLMLLYSVMSFACALVVFYIWLLFFAVINRRVPDDEPFQKLTRLYLGRVARWPRGLQCVLPLVAVAGLWLAVHPFLAWSGIISPARTYTKVLLQAALVGSGGYLTTRYVIACVLLAYLLNSYVYLGNNPVWSFVNVTSRNLLSPLRRLPLRAGRVDFTPVVGIALIFLVAEVALYWLPKVYPN